jgi:predicted metal-dependent hydrolase
VTPGIAYTVRRSDRARRVRVTVDPSGAVEVVLPRRAGRHQAAAAVEELRPWIERRLADVACARAEIVRRRNGMLPLLGESLRLVREPGRTRAFRRGDALHVPMSDADSAIERWLRRIAREEIVPRLDEAVAALDVSYEKLRIANQRTRWGSCSTTGTMSFNWRLLLADEAILDYVIWHEACHLRHLDHSPSFWQLLERHRPSYRGPQAWLRRYGATLVL